MLQSRDFSRNLSLYVFVVYTIINRTLYFLFQPGDLMSTAAHGQFIIGNYRVSKTLGEGTFGKVRLGVHIPTSEKVAVKTLQKQKIAQQADIQRVTREICILKILRHPNIVQLYEIIETKTDIHLIMEYASGGELFDYIVKKKRLQESEAVTFMQQILSGVEYIHKNGIVHRDLKPENLLFDENKRIKIVDFGLSNQYKPGERLKTACGSPCYAAPEMIAGKRYECLNIDVWSCGIILYAMLCGYLPFEDSNTNKLYKKIMSGEYEQPKMLTPDSKQILNCILNVNPEARFKINQIKESKWYNLTGSKYEVPGIVVGTDAIVPDERVIATMKSMGVALEPNQIKTYIVNNRHNHVTAFYYLLKKKAEKNPSVLVAETKKEKQDRRSSSPMIFKPEVKKEFFMPSRKTSTADSKDNTKVNDSFNASTIVSSLIEANKNRLINSHQQPKVNKKIENFDKYEEFKLFPRHKNSSQYEPQSPLTLPLGSNPHPAPKPHSLTSRSDVDDKKLGFSAIKVPQKDCPSSLPEPTTDNQSKKVENLSEKKANIVVSEQKPSAADENGHQSSASRDEVTSKNKRREELSDQLKQISLKIDKEIIELRKHNNMTSSMMSQKRRESFTSGVPVPNLKFRLPEKTDRSQKDSRLLMSDNLNSHLKTVNTNSQYTSQERTQTQPVENSKLSLYKQMPTKFPKMHFGPFNARCLVMEAPRSILLKIEEYLTSAKVVFKEIDLFTLRLAGNEVVSVESIHGISGYHVVKFSMNSPMSESIIDFLSQ